jgi:hypothetical protein
MTFVEPARHRIPAGVCSQGSLVEHTGHAHDFVAVCVNFRNQCRKNLADGGGCRVITPERSL